MRGRGGRTGRGGRHHDADEVGGQPLGRAVHDIAPHADLLTGSRFRDREPRRAADGPPGRRRTGAGFERHRHGPGPGRSDTEVAGAFRPRGGRRPGRHRRQQTVAGSHRSRTDGPVRPELEGDRDAWAPAPHPIAGRRPPGRRPAHRSGGLPGAAHGQNDREQHRHEPARSQGQGHPARAALNVRTSTSLHQPPPPRADRCRVGTATSLATLLTPPPEAPRRTSGATPSPTTCVSSVYRNAPTPQKTQEVQEKTKFLGTIRGDQGTSPR